MTATREQIDAGQAIYTPATLRSYDLVVHGVSNRWIWRCPTWELLQLYNRHVTARHLDVGVGTGYFLDRCRFPSEPYLALLDLNPHCLERTARRLSRYRPTVYRASLLEPLQVISERFDSIGLNYVLHCLPGTMDEKSVALRHLAALLNPGGVLFGATLLTEGVRRNWAARRLMRYYNRCGIFSNEQDGLKGLLAALQAHLSAVEVRTLGCAALFWGSK